MFKAYQALMLNLAQSTEKELAAQVHFLRAEKEILRGKFTSSGVLGRPGVGTGWRRLFSRRESARRHDRDQVTDSRTQRLPKFDQSLPHGRRNDYEYQRSDMHQHAADGWRLVQIFAPATPYGAPF